MIIKNYIVLYQGDCDPAIERCFASCTDGTCQQQQYYMKVQKYVPDVYAECGSDMVGCAKANMCLPSDMKCSITYCSSSITSNDEHCVGPNDGAISQMKQP